LPGRGEAIMPARVLGMISEVAVSKQKSRS
jgi:hypothetical protein